MIKMKAAVLYEHNKPLRIEELSLPEPLEGQVLVKIAASGICHSQLNEIKGRKGPDKYLPHTLGHEGAGVVESVGPKVTKVKKGDHVILSWIKGSGINALPPVYYNGNHIINSGQLSTFNEYTVTSENRVTPITKDMPFDKAALLGCAVATGMGVIINNANIKMGNSVAVFGVGGIGLSVVHAASIKNASMIIAIDINNSKLNLAKKLGATHIINAKKKDVVKALLDLTTARGVDYAVESVGLKKTMEEAFQSVKYNGGKAIIVGNLAYNQKILIDPFALISGKQIVGSWGGETNPDKDFPYYVGLYLSGKLKLDKMIYHKFKLHQINDALELLKNGSAVGRVILEL